MNRHVTQAALSLALLIFVATAAMSAHAQPSVGVSVDIRQPGVYGRIDIGSLPPPPVVLPQPVLIAPPRVVVAAPPPPLYLYVPPGHQKNWAKHCARYDACGRSVYFVQERWVRERYEEAHRHDHDRDRDDRDRRPGHGKGHGKHKGHDD